MFTYAFSHSGIKAEFDADGHASTLDGGVPVISSRDALLVPPNAGDSIQYLAYDECEFIRASTVAKYRHEFAEAYVILFNDVNIDFAIDESIDECTPNRCTQCAISSCVVSELVNNPRISGASLTVEAIRFNYARIAFNLDDDAYSRLRENAIDLTLDQILRMQCLSDGDDARLYLQTIFAATDPSCSVGIDFSSLTNEEALNFAIGLQNGAIQPSLLCAEGPWFELVLPESFCIEDFQDAWYAELNFASAFSNPPFGWSWCLPAMCIQVPQNNSIGPIIRRDARILTARAFDEAYHSMVQAFKSGSLMSGPQAENFFISEFEARLAALFNVQQDNVTVNRNQCIVPGIQGCAVVGRQFGQRYKRTGCDLVGDIEYID